MTGVKVIGGASHAACTPQAPASIAAPDHELSLSRENFGGVVGSSQKVYAPKGVRFKLLLNRDYMQRLDRLVDASHRASRQDLVSDAVEIFGRLWKRQADEKCQYFMVDSHGQFIKNMDLRFDHKESDSKHPGSLDHPNAIEKLNIRFSSALHARFDEIVHEIAAPTKAAALRRAIDIYDDLMAETYFKSGKLICRTGAGQEALVEVFHKRIILVLSDEVEEWFRSKSKLASG